MSGIIHLLPWVVVTLIYDSFLLITMPQDSAPRREPYYECADCGRRVTTAEDGRLCSKCGGYLQNIGVPREQ